ncbi:MAG TPA: Gfo/Idh/MocA family oxidoreductase, partial [Ferruginibacter sp.]|nr:Gfo/Idh/MocA family oxidoreductase [Ferruginibacter sp.]
DIDLFYPKFSVRVKAGYFVKQPLPAYIMHGTKGSFLKPRADVQESNLLAGMKPNRTDWGTEPESAWGLLHVQDDQSVVGYVTSEQGNYYDFYAAVYESLITGSPMPVTADDGINVMRIIEASLESNRQQRVVKVS